MTSLLWWSSCDTTPPNGPYRSSNPDPDPRPSSDALDDALRGQTYTVKNRLFGESNRTDPAAGRHSHPNTLMHQPWLLRRAEPELLHRPPLLQDP